MWRFSSGRGVWIDGGGFVSLDIDLGLYRNSL